MKHFNHKAGKHFQIDSAKNYCEETGNPQKQPLIFLHGGFGNIEDFNEIIPLLDKEYRIIGIDSRGQGKSTLGNEKLTYERLEKDIHGIITELNLDNPIVVGFSDGGIAALRLAGNNRINIDKLIVIGSTWHSKSLESTKDILGGITAEIWKKKFPKTYEMYQKLNPEPNFDKLSESIVQMWVNETNTGRPNEKVENIKCPTLIVRGDKDHLMSKNSAFELSEKINAANLANIPFCGHEVYVEQKEILMNLINQFLK